MLSKGILLDNRYEIIKVLGRGGMSTVYLAKDTRLDKLWAIKEVKNSFRGQMDLSAEPNILKQLNHVGIPKIIDIFYENDNLYMVEDYIEGYNLEEYIKINGNVDSKAILLVALKLCEILEYLHGLNPPIIYRDLKPQNIIISKNHQVTLVDFGISRTYKSSQIMDTIVMGTKGYAAPEQYGMAQSDFKTDIYGLGAVMFFLAAGRSPNSPMEPLKDDSYSIETTKEIRDIIKKCMQLEANERYESINVIKQHICSLINNSEEGTKVLENHIFKHYSEKTQLMGKENNKHSVQLNGKSKGRKRSTKKMLLVASTLVVLVLCLSGFALYNRSINLLDDKGKDKVQDIQDNSSNKVKEDAEQNSIDTSANEDTKTVQEKPDNKNNQVNQPKDSNKNETINPNNDDFKNWGEYKKYLEEYKKNNEKQKGKGKNKNKHD